MANPTPDINSILRMLGDASQRPATSTPTHSQPGLPAPVAPPLSSGPYAPPGQNPYPAQPVPYQPPPPYGSYPQPSSGGSIDLSKIHPVNSGTVAVSEHLADAIAKAKAYAAEQGVTPYDRPAGAYPDQRQSDSRQYRRSRSKSPRGRDSHRDSFNPYRDERRGDHGGQGREYGRDRSYSPGRGRQGFSPRGGQGGGRERSPLRGKDDNVETIEIESSLVGLIIGRQGENLRRVEGESRCRVQFVPATGQNDQYRLCKISGPRPQREEAKEMINRIIRDSGMRGSSQPGGDGRGRDSARGAVPPPVPKEGEDSLQIMVPDRTVGLIIGRGGETIRDLQERSGCHINIVSENKSVNGLRPVNLIGPPAAARHAKELILEIVDSDSRNGNNPVSRAGRADNFGGGGGAEKVNDSIFVPSDAVGMIIGKGGETIREMQNMTGCKINVSQSSGPGEVEREIGLVGSRDSITRAKRAIEEKVDAARQKSAGGGGRGRGHHRDYDNPNYGQPSNSSSAPPSMPAGSAAPAAAGSGNQSDPYAMYGGYENYIALWWQSQLAAQQAQGQGAAGQAPGTS
ncbi:P element somatic inhibitor [Madurella fahalii]|uniref:P element somatic inhibitor n=1 Tax=Madurella fahalii TaxID=1157608 RepID=A0ABQ0G4B7_9PEZI